VEDDPPRLLMIAGPNGSGKSTLINALRADARFELLAL
jgi:ABC-type cobalamin/Fe3+-siderophores transport system ATPase subunit